MYYGSHLLLVCLCLATELSSATPPVAQTRLGSYRGHYRTTLNGRRVAAFNGVRYATPPLGKLRFKEAEMVQPHEGMYEATQDGDDCLQENQDYNKYLPEETSSANYVGQEDCLFLNIYTPNLKPDKPYPVVVYIHGGSYIIGTSASNYHGPELLLDKDVVLVALNYRLGVFGFLSADDEILPGNLGLKDQSLALRWVRDNIASFGGDPDSVTLMGHSAGAACSHLHMTSPLSKGLMHRAISQSGSGDSTWSIIPTEEAREFSSSLATGLGCPLTPAPLLSCLQGKSWQSIMYTTASILSKTPIRRGLGPVLEKEEAGRFMSAGDLVQGSTLPWMTGVTKDEGLLILKEFLSQTGDKDLSNFNSNYGLYLPEMFGFFDHPRASEMSRLLKEAYFGRGDINGEHIQQLANMISDGMLFHGQLVSTRKHKGRAYFYLVTHPGRNSLSTGLPMSGVGHADELFYLFPFSKQPRDLSFSQEDSTMQILMVQLWTDFIIHGDPTPGETEVRWNESQNGKVFVTIAADGITPQEDFFSARMDLWNYIFTDLLPTANFVKDEL